MKLNNFYFFSVIAVISFMLYSCANQGTPTGGPRDTIPPTIITSVPQNQSLNYNGNQVYFLFDERINADKLKQQLVISPNTDLEYSYVVKKDELVIKLESALEDSITYTFSFLDGVTDITENNPVQNFKLAFSTGPYIDSIYVAGEVTELLTGLPATKYIVGLYDVNDTITIFNGKPKYFTTLGESSAFRIENIKIGKYQIYAWKDDNRNLELETEKEAYAFRIDTLDLSVSRDSINLVAIGINTKEPDLLSSRIAGRYFDLKYNKQLLDYKAFPKDSMKSLPNQLINTEKLIRFYNTAALTENDSLIYYVEVIDSLNQVALDTVAVKFRATKKKSEELKILNKKTNNLVKNQIDLQMTFSKPVMQITWDSVNIALDTLAYIDPTVFTQTARSDTLSNKPGNTQNFTWNANSTTLELAMPINWKYINDSIRSTNDKFRLLDSLSTDTTRTPFQPIKQNTFKLIFEKGAVISIEQDTLSRQALEYTIEDPDELGMFIINLITERRNYWLEAYNKDTKEVERSIRIKDQQSIKIPRLKPGKYAFNIKLDNNKDGVWSYGNILRNEEPDTIIYTNVESALRANFEVTIELEF
ncbi:MAG: Ig-like domain-containing domain [Cyclobacteriaceae bacterium]